jgi:hypothetical protein
MNNKKYKIYIVILFTFIIVYFRCLCKPKKILKSCEFKGDFEIKKDNLFSEQLKRSNLFLTKFKQNNMINNSNSSVLENKFNIKKLERPSFKNLLELFDLLYESNAVFLDVKYLTLFSDFGNKNVSIFKNLFEDFQASKIQNSKLLTFGIRFKSFFRLNKVINYKHYFLFILIIRNILYF